MLPSFQTVNQMAQTLGWGVIMSFVIWAWRKSVTFTVLVKTNHAKSQKAMEQIDQLATNHFPHMESGIVELNKKTEEGNEALSKIATGMAILVDRGTRA